MAESTTVNAPTQADDSAEKMAILQTLVDLHQKNISPYQQGVQKALKEAGQAHTAEALQQGVPAEHIVQQSGLDPKTVLSNLMSQGQGQAQGQVNIPKQGMFETNKNYGQGLENILNAQKIQNNFSPDQAITKMADLQKKVNDVLPGWKVDQTSDGKFVINSGASNDLVMAMKEDQFKQKRLQVMGDDLDPSKNVRNPYGVAQLGLNRAERIEGLVSQYKDLNLDAREMEELAIGLNSMLQGSNISAQRQVMDLIPKSAVGNVTKMKEWLMNEPQGLNQQKFVQRMLNDVRREKQVFQGQVMSLARSKIAKYPDLIKKYPDETADIMKSFKVDPELYAKWKEGGFKDAPPTEISAQAQGGWTSDKETRYQELLKKRGAK